jgi:murein tripeptide amidase MpaA
MDDYAYDQMGWFGFTDELWDMPTTAGVEPRDFIAWMRWHPEEDDLKLMRWNDEEMDGEAFENWRTFEHPQLGVVEIGGWKTKLYQQNMPLKYLLETCQKHSSFTLSHALLNPYLSLRNLDVKARGENVYHVTAVIENSGFLPTYTSKKAQERKVVQPIAVELTLPEEVSFVMGQRWQEIGQLEGRSNKLWGGFYNSSSPTDNRAKIEWVLNAKPGSQIELTVRAQRAGVLRHQFTLE